MTKRDFQKQKRRRFQELKEAVDSFCEEEDYFLPLEVSDSIMDLQGNLQKIEEVLRRWWKSA